MGGGTYMHRKLLLRNLGLSPRGRGNPYQEPVLRCYWGSIPAWAGEPICSSALIALSWVYPRVGGGNLRIRVG